MPVAARVAANEARFAAANDAIAEVATALPPRPFVPFLCECPEPRCSAIVELSLGEYAVVRLYPNHFIVSPLCTGAQHAWTLIVEQGDRYTVVDRLDG
jgi:hypothetical protein